MDGCDPVDFIGANHCQMAHANLLDIALLNNTQGGNNGSIAIPAARYQFSSKK